MSIPLQNSLLNCYSHSGDIFRYLQVLPHRREQGRVPDSSVPTKVGLSMRFWNMLSDVLHTALFCSLTLLVKTATNLQSKLDQVIPILKSRTGPAIIYVTLQKEAEDVALILQNLKISADAYHAGLKTEERKRVQDSFALSQDGIVSAAQIIDSMSAVIL